MRFLPLFLLILLFPVGSKAQTISGFVVSTCGTPPSTYTAGSIRNYLVDINGNLCVNISAETATFTAVLNPTTASSGATTSCTSSALESNHSCKSSAGNLYGFYASGITGTTSGFILVFNATAAPSDGAVTPLDWCQFTSAAGCSLNRIPIPRQYGTGISIAVSSASTPFTKTTTGLTAAFSVDFK